MPSKRELIEASESAATAMRRVLDRAQRVTQETGDLDDLTEDNAGVQSGPLGAPDPSDIPELGA